nr:tRNA nucleotidyltransferase [bacterium]
MQLPQAVLDIIQALERAGFEGYAVGGCVRDNLMGRPPHDWDICTNAQPAAIQACMAPCPMLTNGIKHGTVGVIIQGQVYEITTYRVDGAYRDHRHPAGVCYVDALQPDLARRDFTINAMAYHPMYGLVDPFGGRQDIALKRIRAVGDAMERFEEDGLRILRGIRLASELGFSIEENTRLAMGQKKHLLACLARERIWAELSRWLMGTAAAQTLAGFPDILNQILPGIAGGPEWDELVHAIGRAPARLAVRLALLICRRPGRAGEWLDTLRPSRALRSQVLQIAGHIGQCPKAPADALYLIARTGEQTARDIAAANIALGIPGAQPFLSLIETLLAGQPCYRIDQLAVDGGDLMRLGIPRGPQIGRVLALLLDGVIRGEWSNNREALLAQAQKLMPA